MSRSFTMQWKPGNGDQFFDLCTENSATLAAIRFRNARWYLTARVFRKRKSASTTMKTPTESQVFWRAYGKDTGITQQLSSLTSRTVREHRGSKWSNTWGTPLGRSR